MILRESYAGPGSIDGRQGLEEVLIPPRCIPEQRSNWRSKHSSLLAGNPHSPRSEAFNGHDELQGFRFRESFPHEYSKTAR